MPLPLSTHPTHSLRAACSEEQLDALAEALYNDSKLVVQQAVLVVLEDEEEPREEPPGGACAPATQGQTPEALVAC